MVSAIVIGRAARGFHADQAGPGRPGRRGADDGAQHRRAVEAGGAQPRRAPPPRTSGPPSARCWRDLHRPAARRCGCSSRSASAPPPSACRTCCSNPMAARSCGLSVGATTSLTALWAIGHDRRVRDSPRGSSAPAPIRTGSPGSARVAGHRRLPVRDLRRAAACRRRARHRRGAHRLRRRPVLGRHADRGDGDFDDEALAAAPASRSAPGARCRRPAAGAAIAIGAFARDASRAAAVARRSRADARRPR